ncbi:MAG: TetR-like C-terminal domain-containing protein, partial [Saccharofermentanales bacterium]
HAPVDYWRALMRYLYDNRAFYANALEASGQNCFADYFSSRMRPILVEHCRGQLGEQPYADEFSEGLVDGIVMFITRWLQEWPHIEPDRLIELLQEGLVKLSKYILSEQAGGAAETR